MSPSDILWDVFVFVTILAMLCFLGSKIDRIGDQVKEIHAAVVQQEGKT